MWNGVGGSTNVYGAIWPRFRPSDFRKGDEHGLAPNWPISYEDLAPFYERADRLIGTSGLAGDLAMPPRATRAPQGLALHPRRGPARVKPSKSRLALVAGQAGVISENYDGRARLQRLRHLQRLPARLDEQVLALDLAASALLAGTRAAHLCARAQDRERARTDGLTGAVSSTATPGRSEFQSAEVVILAANGVGTPRLLLASDNLANQSDQVGRNLLHHTLVTAEFWVDEPIARHMGYVASVIGREFAETDV